MAAPTPLPPTLRSTDSGLAVLATCSLNQWALDFDGNLRRTLASCAAARASGARYRLGPELELTGYGCEDHFLEPDTEAHAWESLAALLSPPCDATEGMLVDVGMPVTFRGVRYNCRVWALDHRVLLIRPKLVLADDGNYRESRWFRAYVPRGADGARVRGDGALTGGGSVLEDFPLPPQVVAATAGGQTTAPFGVGVVVCADGCSLASETCEELFAPTRPGSAAALDGVEVLTNGSGSHHELRKLHTRVELIARATAGGCAYLYANQRGCDGGRLFYDGCALAAVNGGVVAQGGQFGLREVEVVTAVVDVGRVRAARGAAASRGVQAAAAARLPRVHAPGLSLCASRREAAAGGLRASPPAPVRYLSPPEEVALGPACWLWDFLRRSGAGGYFLPLSGGADSAATAALVGVMCHLLHRDIAADAAAGVAGGGEALGELRRVLREPSLQPPPTPAAIAHRVLHTAYLATAQSSPDTRARAAAVAANVGCYHVSADIDAAVAGVLAVFGALFGTGGGGGGGGLAPRFASQGGSRTEDLALQNVQARLRMVVSYLLAQLLPWARGAGGGGGGGGGFLLVLGSANVDEALRGYLTKYDCSSADINPIGGVAKGDLRAFLLHAADAYGYASLRDVVAAPPSAELVPIAVGPDGAPLGPPQLDEVDMGMSYEQLGVYGRLRQVSRCGPVSMYVALCDTWRDVAPAEVARRVKHFFVHYAANRHKATTLTPSYHAEAYGPEDNRFDLRPFLYPTGWGRQFAGIDADVEERRRDAAPAAAEGAR